MTERGERAPDFVLPDLQERLVRFYGIAGGTPVALAFCADGLRDAASLAAALGSDAQVVAVHSGALSGAGDPGFPVLIDHEGAARALYRLDAEPAVVLLDANLRVLDTLPLVDAGLRARDVVAAARIDVAATDVVMHAPVLLMRDAIPAATCRELIEVFETQGSLATGIEISEDGRRREMREESFKRRRDHTVVDPDLMRTLTTAVGRRVMPEVWKAFVFKATRFEGFKIACYEAGGLFRAHRDNLSPRTAHRRFALTLNLNDDYDGGHLRFPEYGPHLYRPPAGGALVFSGAHLHEVLPVTRGCRFVLLSFLFGEDDVRAPRTG